MLSHPNDYEDWMKRPSEVIPEETKSRVRENLRVLAGEEAPIFLAMLLGDSYEEEAVAS